MSEEELKRKAKEALKLWEESSSNVSAGYDVLRYAQQGFYEVKNNE